MANVFDVAAYIVQQKGATEPLTLHKLLYFAQGWALAWDSAPLYAARIEAWKYGPVLPDVYGHVARGRELIRDLPEGDPTQLSSPEREIVDGMLGYYGKKSVGFLVELSHREPPWREARGPLPPDARSSAEITVDALRSYFGKFASFSHRRAIPEAVARGFDMLVSLSEQEIAALEDTTSHDARPFLNWLETGSGDPWAKSSS